MSQGQSIQPAANELPLELAELSVCLERLLDERESLRGERETLQRRLAEQDAELENLRTRLRDLSRGHEAARQRLDGVIGHLSKLEGRA